ncbi:hypothetical protein G6F56_010014 [Rhizopus delemar]|nr:hypothetical protein G6F56_010014 [Rhizopus delemar]
MLISTTKKGISYCFKPPNHSGLPTLCFIPGFQSNFITSKKSKAVYDYATQHGIGFLSWNYNNRSVYGYFQDSLSLIRSHSPCYLVGSSMGLWISLLVAKEIPIKGILGVGGSVNFTERWWMNELTQKQREMPGYIWKRPTPYDPQGYYNIPVSFLIESKKAIIHNFNDIQCPKIILLHGTADQDASFELAQQLSKDLSPYTHIHLYKIEGGDHRLSSPKELGILYEQIRKLMT